MGFSCGQGWAQAPNAARQPPARATLQQCYRALSRDSVVFFYDAYYTLVPPGCAAIRRHARVDSAGAFHGVVQDYQLSNNVLLLSGAYRHGRKQGVFELFYSDGEPAARVRYHEGKPVGDWAYWYHSGQPRQVVRFEQPERPTLQRFWAVDGKPLVVNGTGQWQQDEAGTRQEGAIRNGVPDGQWTRRYIQGRQPYSVEYFDKGTFRKGTIFHEAEPGEYVLPLDAEQPPFMDAEDYDRAEALVLGALCPPVSPPVK
ncbi:toxin-antitoxin system YwqK family antitoxin [Hymenobacter endophyticus]